MSWDDNGAEIQVGPIPDTLVGRVAALENEMERVKFFLGGIGAQLLEAFIPTPNEPRRFGEIGLARPPTLN